MRAKTAGSRALWILLALALVRLWVMPLPSSFWVDEMATAFVVNHGAAEPSLRVAPQVAASVYYALPRLANRMLGSSEVAYRIPSLLAMLAALVVIARLAARLIHPQAGWFAAFACLALRGFDYQAADARPYALGTLVACVGLWFLVRWLDSGAWRDALLFSAAAALLWRVHLVYWPFYTVWALYAVIRMVRGESPARPVQLAAVCAVVAASLMPVLAQAMALRREAGAHVITALPQMRDLFDSLKPGLFATAAAAALAVAWGKRKPRFRPGLAGGISGSGLSLICCWWLAAPAGLFAFSRLTGNSVFLARYFSLSLPGAAVAATALAACLVPPERWRAAALVLGAGVLLLLGHWNMAWPPHHNSDWRGAAAALRRQGLASNTPVVCPSPFIEARPPVWRPDYPVTSFLYSHLLVYPPSGKIDPFPFDDSAQAERFATGLAADTLAPSGRFAVYGPERSAWFWRRWLAARPELAGWRVRRLGDFGDVEAFVFEDSGEKSDAETPRR